MSNYSVKILQKKFPFIDWDYWRKKIGKQPDWLLRMEFWLTYW